MPLVVQFELCSGVIGAMGANEILSVLSPLFIIGGVLAGGIRWLWNNFKKEMQNTKQDARDGISLLANKLDEQNEVYVASRKDDTLRFSALELQQARVDAKTAVLIAVFSACAHNTTLTRIDVTNGGDKIT